MRQKMAIFKEGNSVCRVQKIFRSHFIYTKNFQGGDATENRDFQREKQRLQGTKFFSDLILSKERIFFLEQGRGLF